MEREVLEETWRGILGRLKHSEGPNLVSAIFARVLCGPELFADAFLLGILSIFLSVQFHLFFDFLEGNNK